MRTTQAEKEGGKHTPPVDIFDSSTHIKMNCVCAFEGKKGHGKSTRRNKKSGETEGEWMWKQTS